MRIDIQPGNTQLYPDLPSFPLAKMENIDPINNQLQSYHPSLNLTSLSLS